MSDTTSVDSTVLDETTESSFAQELIKTMSINAAATAATLATVVAIGFGASKVQELRERRAAKKALNDTTVPTTEA